MIWRVFFLFAFLALHTQLTNGKRSKVIKITSENWRKTLEGEWMIKFYAPWCPACRAMAGDYETFAELVKEWDINVAEVDITEETALSGRFIVTALPTMYHGKNGEFRRYAGSRDPKSLRGYVLDEMWTATEPIAWYRHPTSIAMTCMSYLFQTSKLVKVFHDTLTEQYGFSDKMSYVLFGIVTIITGLVLGLILVVIIDFVAPQKQPAHRPVPSQPQNATPDSAEDDGDVSTQESQASSQNSCSHASSTEVSSGSEDDGGQTSSQPVSQTASQKSLNSEEWEKVTPDDNAENSSEEKEEGQGELRRRKINKDEEIKEE